MNTASRMTMVAVALLALGACASAPPAPSAPPEPFYPPSPLPPPVPPFAPPAPPTGWTPAGYALGAKAAEAPEVADPSVALRRLRVVSRIISPLDGYMPAGLGMPTAVVLLDRTRGAQNAAMCAGLMSAASPVPTLAEARAKAPLSDFLVTQWMLARPVASADACGQLLPAYDYDRAAKVKAAYGLKDVTGPVILAFTERGDALFVDFTASGPPEVKRFASDWLDLAVTFAAAEPDAPAADGGPLAGVASWFAGLVSGDMAAVEPVSFADPRTGVVRSFDVARAGALRLGTTFPRTRT